jgi:hypothetical protein
VSGQIQPAFDENAPRHRWQVHPGETLPARHQETSDDDEDDERHMRDSDGVSCYTKECWQI